MDGVLAVAGHLFVQMTVVAARGAVALNLLAAVLLAVLRLRLLLRRTSLCAQAKALAAGLLFAVSGCPGCAPIAIGVGSSAALTGGPVLALVIVAAFIAGRTAVLIAAAALGSRLLPASGGALPWRRLDTVVGGLFLLAADYYAWRLLSGGVSTLLPVSQAAAFCPDRPAPRSAASRARAVVEQGLRQWLDQSMCVRRGHDAWPSGAQRATALPQRR